jgi:acyl carrier protein phosphodiesterase
MLPGMNYLAHLYLASHSGDAMLGALLGDFVKPHSGMAFSADTEAEILTHRKVDAFTDSHPVVLDAKRLFDGPSRRFSGILLDVFYDHVLASSWTRYSSEPLPDFIARVYRALATQAQPLPPNFARVMPYMIEQDWLGSYVEYEGVETAVRRISTRLSKNGDLMRDGLVDVRTHYAALEAGFHAFFPELVAFVNQRRT